MRFRGKVALISAAGAGIGRATAMIIGREGGTVVAVDVEQGALDRLTAELGAAGGRALALRADALDAQSVEAVVRRAGDAHGRIDILVNAVGGSTVIERPAALLDELTLEEWQRLLHFNLTGTFLFCRAVVPVMKRQRNGKIVNLSSIAGRGLSQSSSEASLRVSAMMPQAGLRARPARHHGQRHRPQPRALRAHPSTLGAALGGGPSRRDQADPTRAGGHPRGPGAGHLLSRLCGRRLRDRRHHRRDRGPVANGSLTSSGAVH